MDYSGENLLPGQLGHFFITLSLVASLAATFSYFKSANAKTENEIVSWKKLARIFFFLEIISVFAIFAILFYIISNHLFEYKYAWQHSSRSLEGKYLLACFWEGQEGSFLLWSLWHAVLGGVLIFRSKKWEAPVMTVISFAQFALATMICGFYFFGEKVGSNPFQLLRDSGVLDNAPQLHLGFDIAQGLRPDYMSFIRDGNDLNPLLQNYWMVIHPPVLFLGFASMIIPFAYAIAGLWKRNPEWTKPALPWSLFAAATLGTGIMMGAMWAYESLTFGGYWAWDPVENASLVPWLIMIGGIHTMLIYRATGHSLRTTYLFIILSFLFILYSTYLTRSGDLQDTSVHAFTDLGMNWQLRIFLFSFIIPSLVLYINRYKTIPHVKKEEEISSREFWMFIGSLVFFLSALFIIGATSLPVINSLFGTNFTMPENIEYAYNRIMIFIAVVIGFLTAFGQYLKYQHTSFRFIRNKLLIPTVAAVLIAGAVIAFGDIDYRTYGPGYLAAIWLALVAAVYSVIANAAYIWLGLKGSLKISGGSLSHVGFGLILVGILISSSKKEVLSYNTSGIFVNFGEKSSEKSGENLTLVKGVKTDMGKYWVTYESDSVHPKKPLWYYNVRFVSKDSSENFTLTPNAFVNYKGNEGLMANPDARHYWNHDIFSYITSLPDPEKNQDTATFKPVNIKVGDTTFYSKGYFIVKDIISQDSIPVGGMSPDDKAHVANISVHAHTGSQYISRPILIQTASGSFPTPDTIQAESLVLRLDEVMGKNAVLGVRESNAVMQYLTLKAYKFPFINILWAGTVIMVVGMLLSMARRRRLNRLKSTD